MAAAKSCRATLNTGFSINLAVRHRCPIALPSLPACIRSFNNTTPIIEADNLPPEPPVQTPQPQLLHEASKPSKKPRDHSLRLPYQPIARVSRQRQLPAISARYDINRAPTSPVNAPTTPLQLTDTIRQYLPHLTAQPPFYVTIHIHGKPYLVTAGDTVRLPFLMHGVMPGDILRLDKASIVGSRDWTLRSGSPTSGTPAASAALGPQDSRPSTLVAGEEQEPFNRAELVIGKTSDLPTMAMNMHESDPSTSQLREQRPTRLNKPTYLDPRLFICRATVLGTESEPMRIMEKTKRRQRHIKHVRSKMRYTMLRIREIRVRDLEELEMAERDGMS